MTWLKVDDGFTDHPKIEALSDQAFRLHVAGLCFCARTLSDGKVPEDRVRRLLPKVTKRMVTELVDGGLWLPIQAGFEIKDYLAYNPSRAEVEKQRTERAERQKKWRDKKRDASRSASGDAAPPHGPPRPGPKGLGSGTEEPLDAGSPPAADGGGEHGFDPEVSIKNADRLRLLRGELKSQREAS